MRELLAGGMSQADIARRFRISRARACALLKDAPNGSGEGGECLPDT